MPLDRLTNLRYRNDAMTDRLGDHFRRLRRAGRPVPYRLTDKPIYNWLHGSQILNRPALSIMDIVEAMPAEVRDTATPLRLTKHMIPAFLKRVGFKRYPQVVRLANRQRVRLWVQPTVSTTYAYQVADAYEGVRDDGAPHRMQNSPISIRPPGAVLWEGEEEERDVWDI